MLSAARRCNGPLEGMEGFQTFFCDDFSFENAAEIPPREPKSFVKLYEYRVYE